jgi:hypothetical protein
MEIGDRVIWLGALDASGNSKGGWAGNGKGRILNYSSNRPYFQGGKLTEPNEPPRGPAILVLLDGGDEATGKKFDVWVRPLASDIATDKSAVVAA